MSGELRVFLQANNSQLAGEFTPPSGEVGLPCGVHGSKLGSPVGSHCWQNVISYGISATLTFIWNSLYVLKHLICLVRKKPIGLFACMFHFLEWLLVKVVPLTCVLCGFSGWAGEGGGVGSGVGQVGVAPAVAAGWEEVLSPGRGRRWGARVCLPGGGGVNRGVNPSLGFPAQARGGSGDNAPYAALRGVVRGFYARLNCKSFSRVFHVFISVSSAEFE